MTLIKPNCLKMGDTIATVSVSHGWAGDDNVAWKYELGKKVLETKFGLKVLAAPNSMKGTEYLSKNPKARAEDLTWAFENKDVKAVMANVGGNDSIKLIPYLDKSVIRSNPKIFVGYSDVLNIHLLCYKAGLSTFYGPNLLGSIAELPCMHPYSEKWLKKVFFEKDPIGIIEPSREWTCEQDNYRDKEYIRKYNPNSGYHLIQGKQCVKGRLIGGHTGIMELGESEIGLRKEDFRESILFVEDIPAFFTPKHIADYFKWLGRIGALSEICGVIIGKLCEDRDFLEHEKILLEVINDEYRRKDLPVLYGLNFGHSSPMCMIPYGAYAEINCEKAQFAILEPGVA
jgi:muramoyltetrapeptide carboxypeptidase LdcA involved in peptidoglycan recycling